MQAGVDYVCVILLGDFEGSYVENASWTFSQPFRYTALATSGDFNLDGTVDAADYVVWRKNVGGIYSPNDYNIWRAHFGQTAGSGAGVSENAAVPEPATLLLLMLAAAGWCLRRGSAA